MTSDPGDGAGAPLGRAADRVEDLTRLIATLAERRLTVATAESLTGGLLAATLTAIPGASAVVRGGLICYATDLKATLAGVDERLLARVGPIHPDVARQLADGARRHCGASIGLGLTGVAGPDPQCGAAPGTVYVAMALADDVRVRDLSGPDGPIGRRAIRDAAVTMAIDLLWLAAGNAPGGSGVDSDAGAVRSPSDPPTR